MLTGIELISHQPQQRSANAEDAFKSEALLHGIVQYDPEEFIFKMEVDSETPQRAPFAKSVTLEQIGELVDEYAFAKTGILDGKAVEVPLSERVQAAQIVATLQQVCKLHYGQEHSPNLTPVVKSFSTLANDGNPSENPKQNLILDRINPDFIAEDVHAESELDEPTAKRVCVGLTFWMTAIILVCVVTKRVQ